MFTKEEIGCVIKASRIAAGMTQAQVAKALSRPQNTISAWEVGRAQPDANTLFELFEVLGRSVDDAFGFSPSSDLMAFSSDEKEHIQKYRLLDQHGKEAVDGILEIEHRRYLSDLKRRQEDRKTEISEEMAGDNYIWLPLSEQAASAGTGVYLGPEAFEQIQVLDNEKTSRADFAVRVQGDSMQPLFQDGNIVLVSKDQPQNGDIALVTLDGCGYVKRLGDGVLISENKRYDPIPMDESIIVNGHVIGVLKPEWIQPWG